MKDINLLHSFKTRSTQFDMKKNGRRAGVILLALILLLAAAYGGLMFGSSFYDGQTALLQIEAQTYSSVSEEKALSNKSTAEIAGLQTLIDTAGKTSYMNTQFMTTLSSALNGSTFLTNFNAAENGTVTFSGKSATRKEIAYFIYSLKGTGLFSDVSVNILNTETQENTTAQDVYDFTATAAVKGAE